MVIIFAVVMIIILAIETFNELKALIREKKQQKDYESRKADKSPIKRNAAYDWSKETTLFQKSSNTPTIIEFESIKRDQKKAEFEKSKYMESSLLDVFVNCGKIANCE